MPSNHGSDDEEDCCSSDGHDQLGSAPLPDPSVATYHRRCCTIARDKWLLSYLGLAITLASLVAMVPLVVTWATTPNTHGEPVEKTPDGPPTTSDRSFGMTSQPPTTSLPSTSPASRYDSILETVRTVSTLESLTTEDTPQNQALKWIVEGDGFQVLLSNKMSIVQRYVLAVLYFSTIGDDSAWMDDLNFLQPKHECEWFKTPFYVRKGVMQCDDEGYVTELDLHHNLLEGTIPLEISALERLQTLYLSTNGLQGKIPTQLGNMTTLQALYLPGNNLTGSIPRELSQLSNLEYFSVSRNRLSGSVPQELVKLSNISFVYLEGNNLMGNINFLCEAWKDKFQIYADRDVMTCECCSCCPEDPNPLG